jgi:hypothetical protein
MPRPSHSSRFDHPNNIYWRVQIVKLLIMWRILLLFAPLYVTYWHNPAVHTHIFAILLVHCTFGRL